MKYILLVDVNRNGSWMKIQSTIAETPAAAARFFLGEIQKWAANYHRFADAAFEVREYGFDGKKVELV